LILDTFLLRKNSAFHSNLLRYASQITLVPPLPLLIVSFLPFPFYLFAGAIRVALIFVLKSESLHTNPAAQTSSLDKNTAVMVN
jgi:hypothetical protein